MGTSEELEGASNIEEVEFGIMLLADPPPSKLDVVKPSMIGVVADVAEVVVELANPYNTLYI